MLSDRLRNLHTILRQKRDGNEGLHLNANQLGLLLDNLSLALADAIELEQCTVLETVDEVPAPVVISLDLFRQKQKGNAPRSPGDDAA